MTLAGLRAWVRLDPMLTVTVITNANLDTVLNQGALEMNRAAGVLIASGTFNTVASQQEYVLSGASPQLTGFLDVYWPSGGLVYTQSSGVIKTSPYNFKVVSPQWLDLNVPAWRTTAASDGIRYAYLSFDASGNHVLGQYPKPSTTTPSWRVFFIKKQTDMSADGDYPWVPGTLVAHLEPFHRYIAEYAKWQCHKMITKNDAEADKSFKEYAVGLLMLQDSQLAVFKAELQGLRLSRSSHANQSFGGA